MNVEAHEAWVRYCGKHQKPCDCGEEPWHVEVDHGPADGLDEWYNVIGRYQ